MDKHISVNVTAEKHHEVRLRVAELNTTIREYLLRLIDRDLAQAKKEDEQHTPAKK